MTRAKNATTLRIVATAGLVMVAMLVTLGTASLTAQNTTGEVVAESPVMSTDFLDPTHRLDLNRYTVPEMCQAALQRTTDSLSFLQRDTLFRDTTSRDPWAPLPVGVERVARQCLDRFHVATLPRFLVGSALTVATALNADSLVRALIALELAAVRGAPAPVRADTLNQIINGLNQNTLNYGVSPKLYWTSGHLQIERDALAQLRALGIPALRQYFWNDHLLFDSASIAEDGDGEVAFWRERQQFLQRIPLDSVSDLELRQMIQQERIRASTLLDRATYFKTASRADLAVLLKDYRENEARGMSGGYDKLLGTQAAPITADYWFNTAVPGRAPTFPAPGTLTLVIFVPSGCQNVITHCGGMLFGSNAGARLRKLQRTYPKLQIIMIAQTGGWFRNRDFATQPEQEAAMLHWYYTDSLRFPGALGVVKTGFEKQPGPDGHVVSLPVAPFTAYPNESWVVVDPTGTIVYIGGSEDFYSVTDDEFLRAWFAVHPSTP